MHRNAVIERQATLAKAATAAPSFMLSLGVTELCFHFHSFSLELLAFGALWGGLFGLQTVIVRTFTRHV